MHKEEIESVQSALQKVKIRPFSYSHQGSLAYIGSDKAIADLPFFSSGNVRGSGGVMRLDLMLMPFLFSCSWRRRAWRRTFSGAAPT